MKIIFFNVSFGPQIQNLGAWISDSGNLPVTLMPSCIELHPENYFILQHGHCLDIYFSPLKWLLMSLNHLSSVDLERLFGITKNKKGRVLVYLLPRTPQHFKLWDILSTTAHDLIIPCYFIFRPHLNQSYFTSHSHFRQQSN